MNNAANLWNQIIARGEKFEEGFKESLNLQPGVTDKELDLLQQKLEVKLPEEVQNFYRVYNGQVWEPGVNPFVRNLVLSPIHKIIKDWSFLQEEYDPDDMQPENEKEIKPFIWNSKWIPIADNGAGDYLCMDMDPTEAGTIGQVLYYWHDWEDRSLDANSLFEFIEICLLEDYDN